MSDMPTVRLSTTSYVVLGMIALRGPSTAYDLKRAVGHSVGYFWPFPHAQLYSEPKRLTDGGYLKVSIEDSGRRRQVYTITPSGRAAVRAWLAQQTNEQLQVRDVAELKLFFSELGDKRNVRRLAREQVVQHESRIRVYEEMQGQFGGRRELEQRMVPLQLGLEMERAALRFWLAIAEADSAAGDMRPAS